MMTDVKFLSAHYRIHYMELKQRVMDLAAKDVRDLVHHGDTKERGQDPENVNTEIDLDHTQEKESMTDTQEKGRETVSVTMRGHTVVKGTTTEQEIVIAKEIVKGKGNLEDTVMEQQKEKQQLLLLQVLNV